MGRPTQSRMQYESLSKSVFKLGLLDLRQLVEEHPGLPQVQCVEALDKPAVDRGEKVSGLIALPSLAPQPRHAYCRAQFPGFRLLRTGDRQGALEAGFGLYHVPLWRHQRDFAGDAMDLRLVPLFLCRLDRRDRFADIARSVIELAKLPTGPCQTGQPYRRI